MAEDRHQRHADPDAERGQHRGQPDARSDVGPLRGQTALGQDDHQGPEAERVGQLGVVEVDPGLAQQHADAQEEQQGRQPEAGAESGGQDRHDDHDGADQQDQVEVDQLCPLPG